MINAELLDQTLQHIKGNQALWSQENWRTSTECGTAYCFGGWVLALSGIPVMLTESGQAYVPAESAPEGLENPWAKRRPHQFPCGAVAAHVLGLSAEQAWDLFHAENSLAELEEMVTGLMSEAMAEQIAEFLVADAAGGEQAPDEPEQEATPVAAEEAVPF